MHIKSLRKEKVDNYAKLEKFEPETYFVDNEQNNKEQESTTLVKNR